MKSIRLVIYLSAGGGCTLKVFEIAKTAVFYNLTRWSPDGCAIIFKDTAQGFGRQSLDKEIPEALKGFDDIRVFYFAFSPTGKLFYSGGVRMR